MIYFQSGGAVSRVFAAGLAEERITDRLKTRPVKKRNDRRCDWMDYTAHYESPASGMTLASDGIALTGLWFDGQKYFAAGLADECEKRMLPVFRETFDWLDLYFSGRQPDFRPALSLQATDFRKRIWEILLSIPFGCTMTYGEIAGRIAGEKGIKKMSPQAVGGAVAHNPVSLIIPCHRVVGSRGELTGYAAGIEKKRWLLQHEHAGL